MTLSAVCAIRVRFSHSLFTGKERDAESGNDYFGARYYASSMGRFLSPDWSAKQDPVPYARLDNPQTLNLYAYLRNNPLGGVDADGHCGGPNDPKCSDVQIKPEVQKTDPQTGKSTAPGVVDSEKQPDGSVKSGARGIIVSTITVKDQPLANTTVDEKNNNKLVIDGQNIKAPTDQGPAPTNNAGQLGDTFGPLFTPSTPAADKPLLDTFKNSSVTMTGTQTLTFTIPGGASCSATATRTLTNGGGGTYTLDPGHYDIKPNP